MGSRRRLTARIASVALVIALAAACSSSAKPTSAPATSTTSANRSTFPGAVCASITSWMNRMVETTNSFSDDSPKLSVPDRRDRYVAAFDDLTRLTDELGAALAQAPTVGTPQADIDAVRAELDNAIVLVKGQIADNRAQASGLSDADYSFQAVNEGHLFTGTEKALSTVLKTLNEQGRAHTIPELEGTCGRR
jgi:hypothetical protein